MQEQVLILDFGSQYTQLIARRVRELHVYCEIHPYNADIQLDRYQAVILSGSPHSVHDVDAPQVDFKALEQKPVLAVCYGAQLMASHFGGKVIRSATREYGRAKLSAVQMGEPMNEGISLGSQVWMSHGDSIAELPSGYEISLSTDQVPIAGFKALDRNWFGIQFHPEVYHTTEGKVLMSNFLFKVCGLTGDWTPDAFIDQSVHELKEMLGNDEVILGLSGGVDSSVAAMLLHRAIGPRLHGIFVDNGLLRKYEYEEVLESYKGLGLNVKGVNSRQAFYDALKGLQDPELKRKAIGKTFIDVFDHESKAMPEVSWLGQGTIYPDVIESVSVNGPSQTIKSHHNVGGLPDYMKLKVVEPLRSLFKDEVRVVGKNLGLPDHILDRHPFPGPGLAIRILGDITEEKVQLLQEVDHIFISSLKNQGLYNEVWQAGAILLPVNSVGVMGDERTYEKVIALRAVTSTDGMTADWCHLPYEFLAQVSNDIINKVKGVNRVVYDISSKPPATIEWE